MKNNLNKKLNTEIDMQKQTITQTYSYSCEVQNKTLSSLFYRYSNSKFIIEEFNNVKFDYLNLLSTLNIFYLTYIVSVLLTIVNLPKMNIIIALAIILSLKPVELFIRMSYRFTFSTGNIEKKYLKLFNTLKSKEFISQSIEQANINLNDSNFKSPYKKYIENIVYKLSNGLEEEHTIDFIIDIYKFNQKIELI